MPQSKPVGHDEAVQYFRAEARALGSVADAADRFGISPWLGNYIWNYPPGEDGNDPIGTVAIRRILTVKANRMKLERYERLSKL